MQTRTRLLFAVVAVQAVSLCGWAQCPAPVEGFHLPGADGKVRALAVFDAGSGPELYAAGSFLAIGNKALQGIARFDGTEWSAVGGPVVPAGGISAMTVFDDGGGPALFVAGAITSIDGVSVANIAKWNGTSWSALGSGLSAPASALAVFQEPGAPTAQLVVAGYFETAGGVGSPALAKWDGLQWSAHAVAPFPPGVIFPIYGLVAHDDGSGSALYVGGGFNTIGGVSVHSIAKWNGATFSALSTGMDNQVNCVASYDADGPGGTPARLFAGGPFDTAGGVAAPGIAQWNGSSWSSVAGSAGGFAYNFLGFDCMTVADLGAGPRLFVRGGFETMGGVAARNVASWNGTAWSALGSGITGMTPPSGGPLAAFDDGSGMRLFVGGEFPYAGSSFAKNIAAWNGATWSAVGGGNGIEAAVRCAEFSSVGSVSGERLYVGGNFTRAGQASANRIAMWDGNTWSALGSGLTPFSGLLFDRCAADLLEFDDGSGRAVYVAGTLVSAGGVAASYIARWNGASWSAVGGGLPAPAYALAEYDDGTGDGPALFAAGNLNRLWRWDGTSWTSPEGIGGGDVLAMVAHDDGSGHGIELFVGGAFTAIGPVAANRVGKWRGTACGPCGTALGSGMNGSVLALAVFDEGATGTKRLFAAGNFTSAGGISADYVARWDGTTWSALGSGPGGAVAMLTVYDDGTGHGPQLFAGRAAVGLGAGFLKKWQNGAWVPVVELLPPANVLTAAVGSIADESPSLFVGGTFSLVDEVGSGNVAQIVRCPVEPGIAFCFGDGSLTTPCPCAPPDTVPNPSGGADGGCANSFHLNGAKILATGIPNPDSVVLHGTRVTPVGLSIFLAGNGVIANGLAGGDGVRCAGGGFVRFGAQFAAAGNVVYPNPSLGHTLPLHAITATALGSGTTIYYQLFYRNAVAAFCNPSTFNFSSAYGVTWN